MDKLEERYHALVEAASETLLLFESIYFLERLFQVYVPLNQMGND